MEHGNHLENINVRIKRGSNIIMGVYYKLPGQAEDMDEDCARWSSFQICSIPLQYSIFTDIWKSTLPQDSDPKNLQKVEKGIRGSAILDEILTNRRIGWRNKDDKNDHVYNIKGKNRGESDRYIGVRFVYCILDFRRLQFDELRR